VIYLLLDIAEERGCTLLELLDQHPADLRRLLQAKHAAHTINVRADLGAMVKLSDEALQEGVLPSDVLSRDR